MAKLKDGFFKQTAQSIGSDAFVLLAGGGSKLISEFAPSFNVKLWGNTFDGSQDVNGVILFLEVDDYPKILFALGEYMDGFGNILLSENSVSWNIFDDSHNPLITILKSGNVGIGVKDAAYKLDVNGSFHYTGGGLFTHFSNDVATFKSTDDIGVVTLAGNGTYGTRLNIQNPDNTNVVASIDYNGKITGIYSEMSENATARTFISTIAEGSAPLTVASTTKVDNLNADMIDGLHDVSLFRKLGLNLDTNTYGDDSNNNGIIYINTTSPESINTPFSYGSILSLNYGAASWMIACQSSGELWHRYRWWSGSGANWSSWLYILTENNYTSITDNRYYTKTDSDSRYVNIEGDTMTGNLTVPSLNSYYLFKDTDIAEGTANLGTLATPHTITFYRNGIMIPYKMDNADDGGMIRTKGASESDCIFEMATWDDYGTGETILFNYYSTTSQLTPTHSVSVPKKSGTIALVLDVPTKVSQLINDSGYVTGGPYLPLSGGTLTGPLTCTANGLIVNSEGGDTTTRVLKAYGSGASSNNAYYINFGKDPSTSNCCELCFNYTGNGSASNYAGIGFYGGIYFKVYANGDSVNPGTMTAIHFYESSDQQLKTNIQAIINTDNMPQIKEFDWKSDGKHSYGLIAQELEEQGYPELVSTKDDGYKTVNYSAALSLIVGKLQVKIRELEKEIEILKNKN